MAIIFIIGCPIGINAMMHINCEWASDDNVWIGYWGAYLGALIPTVAAFVILYIQRKDNRAEHVSNRIANELENEKNRILQKKEIQYRQNMEWLSDFRKAVLDNLAVYTPGRISSLIDILLKNGFSQQDDALIQTQANEMLVQIIQVDTAVGMIVSSIHSDSILKYNKIRNTYYNSICGKITDLQLVSIIIFCLENKRNYSERIVEKCVSQELKDILCSGDQHWNQYEMYRKIEKFLNNVRKENYLSFDQFRQDSINCVKSECQRINKELIPS